MITRYNAYSKYWKKQRNRKKIENDSEKKNGNIVLWHTHTHTHTHTYSEYIYITGDINADMFYIKNSHIY